MIVLAPTVSLYGVKPQTFYAMRVVDDEFSEALLAEFRRSDQDAATGEPAALERLRRMEKLAAHPVTMVSSVNDRRHGDLVHRERHQNDRPPPIAVVVGREPAPVLLGSYHYEGLGVDFDTDPYLPILRDAKREVARSISVRLGPEYDVVLEDLGGQNEHLHVEWDRRRVERARLAAGFPVLA